MTIPYTFAGATTAIPLANLDANFASPITLGNVAMTLSNTYTSIGNLTLTNVTISSASGLAANTVAYANASGVLGGSANLTFNGTTLTTANDASISGLTVGKGTGAIATNTAFGASALAANTTGTSNVAVGHQAGLNNTSASGIVAVGRATLQANTTGTQNIAVGSAVAGVENGALQANTTGNYNIGIGSGAVQANTTGSNNVGIGNQALYLNTTASNNTAVGYQAGYSQTAGGATYNNYLGYQAGYNTTSGTGNVFVGPQTGYTNSTGTQNCFIGYASGYGMTTGSKNTIIGGYSGNQGGLDIRTASNYIVLSDGDGNPRLFSDASGRVIIGTTYQDGQTQFYVEAIQSATARSARFQQGIASGYTGINVWSTLTGSSDNTSCQLFGGYANGSAKIAIYGNGNIQNTNNSYGSLSDIKLKENIVDATPKLDDLMQVKIRNYNLKTDPNHKQIGVIAQELETVFPALVEDTPDRDEEGNALETTTKQVKYSVFVPMLIKAIQELNAKVTALETQLGAKA